MALPSSANPRVRERTGITVGLYPSTVSGLDIELWSASANSTATTVWTKRDFGATTASMLTHTELLPMSTRLRYFKARHTGLGYSAGSFTNVVSARPTVITDQPILLAPLRNNVGAVEFGAGNLWLSSAYTAKVGAQQSTGTQTKTVRLAHSDLVPITTGEGWIFTNVYVQPTTNVAAQFIGGFQIPPGVTLTNVACRMWRATTGDAAFARLIRVAGDAGTVLSTMTHTGTNWQTVSSTLNESVTSTKFYQMYCDLSPRVAGAGQDARFQYMEITYKMPSYDKGL